ncbi:MAG: dockerin type I repeat-containing protein [Oscillospiraceae bacterium]|nr:dockerin type I repeat-containing protein [Oscillospiraceae bacterium]MBR0311856.1 dockerin type I repeat-containing protein [Oscillospiraceae bacterium]
MFKKMLSILLAFAMLLSMIPAGYAEDLEVVDEATDADDIVMIDETIDDEEIMMIGESAEETETVKEPPVELQASESGEERVITPLTLDVEATAEITEAGGYAYFLFTPETTDLYQFMSFASADTYGYLYDAGWNELTYDDDSGTDQNFRIRYELIAGETYYYGVRFYSSDRTGSIPVKLSAYFDNEFSAERVSESSVFVAPGGETTLQVRVSARNMDSVHVEWALYSYNNGYIVLEDENTTSLTVDSAWGMAAYRCRVFDDYGNESDFHFNVWVDGRSTAETLKADTSVVLPFGAAREVRWLRFTPEEDGLYRISYDQWTACYLYDADLNGIYSSQGYIERTLSAGETYYFAILFVNESEYANVTVSMKQKIQITDFASLKAAIEQSDEPSIEVPAGLTIEVTEDYTIPKGFRVYAWDSDFVVPEGVTLTVEGSISANIIRVLGSVNNLGVVSQHLLEGDGEVRNNGTISFRALGDGYSCRITHGESSVIQFFCTDEELADWCAQSLDYTLVLRPEEAQWGDAGTFHISQDLIVPANVQLLQTGTLEIAAGCTVTNNGKIDGYSVNVTGGGTLLNNGEIDGYRGFSCSDDSSVENHGVIRVANMSIEEAGALVGDGTVEYDFSNSYVSVSEDLTIPEGMIASGHVFSDYSVTFVVPEGVTVINNGELRVRNLTIYGSFINNGTLRADEINDYNNGLVNNGTLGVFEVEAVQSQFSVSPNESVTLEVAVRSDALETLSFSWQYHVLVGNAWSNLSTVEGETGPTLATHPITNRTEYICTVRDGFGGYKVVGFNIGVNTHFTARAADDWIAAPFGDTPVMQVIADSDDPGKITYQWYKPNKVYYNDTEYNWSWNEDNRIDGAVSDSLTADPVTEYALYICRVSDGYGNDDSIWIYVYPETHLSARPVEESLYVPLGDTTTLEVIASSDIPEKLSYQWYSTGNDWVKIEGATDSSYVAGPVTEYSRYVCRVYDGFGNSTDVWFHVYVDTHFSAEAVQQNVSVSPNETATLEVTASSDDPDKISYQWCILGMRYNENGDSWNDWIEIEGATDSSYVTDPITEYTRYYCRVSDGYGNTAGVEFYVRIDTHFTAYAANSEVYVPLNSPAELEVIASSDAPEKITYQWSYEIRHYDEHGGYGSEWVEIEGATGSTLTTDPVTERMTYLCQVSDGYGYAVGVSVNVYVDTHFNTWTEQSTITVAPGETATMEMFASSDDPDKITYQWFSLERHYNSDGGYWDEWIAIEGATESSYTTGPVTKRQKYGCRVEDGYGADRWYNFSVTIDYTSQIPMLAQPLALNTPTDAVIEGDCEFAYFYFIPEESDDYILSSLCENEDSYCHLYNEDLQEIATNDDGAGNGNFYLQYYLEAGKTYYYGVRFYGRNSGTIPIILRRSNHLTARPDGNSDLRVPYGETAELSVIASATDASMITYQWSKLERVTHTEGDGSSWVSEEWVEIEGATDSSYTTPAVTEYVQYRCTVEDGYGGRAMVWFNVSVETHFTARAAQSNLAVPFGGTAVLEVIADSDIPDRITYQWYRANKRYYSDNNWGWSYSGDTILAGETSSTLTTPEIKEYQAFVCEASDGAGYINTIWFYVSVDTGFEAWNEQSRFQVAPDSELTLEAFATSDFPELITYQWYEYDYNTGSYTKLEGETGSTYATGAITAERRLECRVSDGYGTETRLSYHILVETHLSAYAKERQITAPLNGTATLQVIASSDVPEKITYAWEGPGLSGSENGPTISVGPMMYESLYYCHVSDGYGGVVNVSFVVRIDTGFYAYPKENPILVAPGEKVSLEIVAGANDPSKLSFEWNKATWEQFGPTYWDWGEGTLLEEETGPTLTTDAINQRTLYYGPVSDGYNNPIWINFEIIVDSGFQVQLEENIQTVYVPYEQTAQLEVPIVTNYPDKLKIQWYRSELYSYMGNFWPMDENIIEGATEASLTTDPVTKAIGYICVIDDGFGNNAIIYFNVFPQTNLTAKAEQETICVNAGDSVTARVIASADEPEKISYQWYESRQVERYGELREEWEYLDGATGAEYPLADVDGYHKLGCMVYDGYGNSVMVTIYVYVQNHFGAEAVNPENYIGLNDRVELKLNVHGDDLTGLSYAWYRWTYIGMGMGYYEYTRIDGADGSSLSVGTEYEKYRCIVTDRYGTPVEVDFAVKIREVDPDGYTITLTDYTKGAAQTSLDFGASYDGSVTFTVSAERPVVVAVKKGDNYTALKCTTVDGEHRYTLNVTEDTELVIAFRGDVNLDGAVKSSEVTMIKRAIAGTYQFKNGMAALTADINGDGAVKSSDATMLARSIAGTYTIKW